jgi:hypothetical protein
VLYGPIDTKYIAPTGEYASIPWGRVAYATIDDKPNPAWPVSPNWALRARHVGGSPTFLVQDNVSYNIVQSVQVAGSDLELVRVDAPFSSYFNMYNGSDEIGKEIVMFGNSAPGKGDRIISEGTGRFNGWDTSAPTKVQPGAGESGALNWGRNRVRDVVDVFGTTTLEATFDAPGLPGSDSVGDDEAIGYNGDSSGAFFIQQGAEWRLAGVTYAVSATYFKEEDTVRMMGAIFDARDLWVDVPVDRNNPDGPKQRVRITGNEPVPFGTYASRVSAYRDSIDTITGQTAGLGPVVVPEAATGQLLVLGLACAYLVLPLPDGGGTVSIPVTKGGESNVLSPLV